MLCRRSCDMCATSFGTRCTASWCAAAAAVHAPLTNCARAYALAHARLVPQGLLEGVKGELDSVELEAWVSQDVDTVYNAATGMAVVLNDVLDLGQVSSYACRGHRRGRHVRRACVGTLTTPWRATLVRPVATRPNVVESAAV